MTHYDTEENERAFAFFKALLWIVTYAEVSLVLCGNKSIF